MAEEIGCTTASIYNWRRLFLSKGVLALQNCRRENPRGPLIKGNVDSTSAEVSALNKEVQDLKMEVAILKETLNILKKDPGVDVSALKNKEKTEIANALKRHFDINQLIAKLELPRSVFYYNGKFFKSPKKGMATSESIVSWQNAEKPCLKRLFGG